VFLQTLETIIEYKNGKDILDHAQEAFPNLIFCKNAEKQLENENNCMNATQIARKLKKLQEHTVLGTELINATPESKPTLEHYENEHTFLLPNGQQQLFSWHLRFTGNSIAGRIFYEIEGKNCFIGHIGSKLPTVKYPT
jgi:hypothetical protein